MSLSVRSRRVGTPGRPAVVLLHGLFGSAANWRTVAAGLADIADLHLLDLPNHGRARWTPVMTYAATAADLAGWIVGEGLDRPVIVGHSMGGKVAMALALTRPSLVHGVAVLDIAPGPSPDGANTERLINGLISLPVADIGTRAEAETALAASVAEPRLRAFLLQNLERCGAGFRWRLNLAVLHRSVPVLKDFAVPDDAAPFSGPSLFLRGDRSAYVTDADRRTILRWFPHAAIQTIPDAGHWLTAEAPERTIAALRTFLSASGGG